MTEEERKALLEVREMLSKPLPNHCAFNMQKDLEYEECGTVGCIGGWMAVIMADGDPDVAVDLMNELMGTNDEYNELFFPGYGSEAIATPWEKITQEQAVIAIDNFLANGDPRWEEILPE